MFGRSPWRPACEMVSIQRDALEEDLSAGGRVHAGNEVEEGGLAGPVGPYDGTNLPSARVKSRFSRATMPPKALPSPLVSRTVFALKAWLPFGTTSAASA